MKASEVNVDMKEMKKFKEENAKDRLAFIDFWANYVRTHTDEEWSKQQNILINSQLKSVKRVIRH